MARVAKENPTWDAKRLAEAESEYRSFLAVAKATPGQDHHNTSVDMDAVWHSHILHTRQYHTDCAQFFGHYFHHAPSERSACARETVEVDATETVLSFLEGSSCSATGAFLVVYT